MKISKMIQRAGTETAFEMLAKAKELERQGKSVIHFEIGEPDFNTPENVKKAGIKAIEENYTHYSPTQGILELREAVAEYISKTRDIKVSPDEVIITPGGKDVIFGTMLSLLDEGDEAIYPNPGYPIYESAIRFVGAKAVPMPIREENDFAFDRHEFEKLVTPKTRLIVINSPANPTGGILSYEDLEFIADIAKKNDIMILSDEIYSRIIYEGKFVSIASIPGMKERTIILDGFSKTYAMTGWRLGYAVANKEVIEALKRVAVNSFSCVATFVQMAGIEALRGPQDEPERMRKEYEERRNLIVQGLNEIPGFSVKMPKGAFYAFPNVKKVGKPSKELADYLLYEAGVCTLSGTAFGEYGEGYLRFSYATSKENIIEGLKRVKQAIEKII
ncbi:pyridoxal phosphate-dependent aminotransferase [Caldisericum exile]|uniref:Aminotransferase n=1 Tax=Caldisericum exile (strain DSM 21853 / NBRC 104410 / AZM16c01) TaxID=511051 RepID=A0A7U6GFK1_CALEA|nr:pyridoxal phosphate-dependent aminotransferase [Caldisericum exile]BAL81466.1 aspartate aminotransferase [Caldisericum exile AZM16c01]